jgi:RNA polymerase sigma factor (sigma-70 family)
MIGAHCGATKGNGADAGHRDVKSADDRLAAIEQVYRERYATFVRVALAVTGDDGLARDAVQDGFVRAVRARHEFRSSAPLEGWLWRIVVNEARRRRAKASRTMAFEARDVSEEPSANGHDGDDTLRALVAALPERQRLALFLRYYADLPYAAIAEALGVAEGTVAATLAAAHTALRARLTEVPS